MRLMKLGRAQRARLNSQVLLLWPVKHTHSPADVGGAKHQGQVSTSGIRGTKCCPWQVPVQAAQDGERVCTVEGLALLALLPALPGCGLLACHRTLQPQKGRLRCTE